MKFIYFLLGAGIGTLIIVYTNPIVKLLGRMGWAERHLGPAGTYLAWKIIGLLCVIAGFWALKS